jgi:hypothetical protein
MKFLYLLLFTIISFKNIANDQDSTQKVWQFHGLIQLNNNGISPVPAFSLGKPSVMTALSLTKGNFIFGPEINYGTDLKPWTVNNWFRYRISKKNFTYGVGFALALFFKNEINNTIEETKAIRYLPIETMLNYKINEHLALNANYWFSNGLDPEAIKTGHFVILTANITNLKFSKTLSLGLRPSLFYIKNVAPFEGFFGSMIANISHKKLPVSVFTQLVKPFWVEPATKFNWNYGLNYAF